MKEAQSRDVTKYRWEDLPEEQLNPLLTRKLMTGDRVRVRHVEDAFKVARSG